MDFVDFSYYVAIGMGLICLIGDFYLSQNSIILRVLSSLGLM